MSRRNKTIFFIIVSVIILGLTIVAIIGIHKSTSQNQFGDFIKIQNYDGKIKNVSSSVKDAIQSSLYNTVKMNVADDFNPATINDAVIRNSSDSQTYDSGTFVYSGIFMVDMSSVKQSYQVQYSYSVSNTIDTGGNPVVVSCPTSDQLKFGVFDCKDLISKQSNPDDTLLQYLPYQNFSFKLSPNKTSGELVIDATLSIADSDLGTTSDTRSQAVAAYKSYVIDWFNSKTLDPSKYTVKYNYTDSGDYLGETTFQ